jgi:hypothetical protein
MIATPKGKPEAGVRFILKIHENSCQETTVPFCEQDTLLLGIFVFFFSAGDETWNLNTRHGYHSHSPFAPKEVF